MKIDVTIEPVDPEGGTYERWIITPDGPETVAAIADLRGTIMEGRHEGHVIEAFAWVAGNGREGDDAGDVITITEKTSGRRIIHAPVMDLGESETVAPCRLDETDGRVYQAMLAFCKHVAFERFETADDQTMSGYLEQIDQNRLDLTLYRH